MKSVQQKLLDCEVMPPQRSWDRIAQALDKEAVSKQDYSDKLFQLEITPPVTAWQNINEALDREDAMIHIAPVRKMNGWKYAVAAIIVVGLGFGAYRLTNTTRSPGLASHSQVSTVPAQITEPTKEDSPKTSNTSPEKNPATAKEKLAHLDQVAHVNMRKAVSQQPYAATASNALYAYEDRKANLADRYVMLMTPEGSIIRMSKKLGDLICCVSGEEQTNDCKYELKKWQEKIATSPLAPSPGNLDILSLVNSLDETEL